MNTLEHIELNTFDLISVVALEEEPEYAINNDSVESNKGESLSGSNSQKPEIHLKDVKVKFEGTA